MITAPILGGMILLDHCWQGERLVGFGNLPRMENKQVQRLKRIILAAAFMIPAARAEERLDLDAIHQIKAEAFPTRLLADTKADRLVRPFGEARDEGHDGILLHGPVASRASRDAADQAQQGFGLVVGPPVT